MEAVQINLGSVLPLPNTGFDKYKCYEEKLSVQVDMISGRRVAEQRGKVWKASYEGDYISAGQMRQALELLHSAGPIPCTVLTPSGETVTANFFPENIVRPTLMGFDATEPIWRGLAFTLREARPHR